MEKGELTHLDEEGAARMVDVSQKEPSHRMAVARARVRMGRETLEMLLKGKAAKGDVLAVARVAGIMAAKKTSDLIPLCHPLSLSSVSLHFSPNAPEGFLEIEARVQSYGPTGVEMEALTAASIAALTVYDMLKGVERGMTIEAIRLVEKRGGASGLFRREGEEPWTEV